ncbi:MAG: peroxiredoxin [Nanoarchaeota archaeon]
MVLINTRAPDFELKGFYEGKIKEFDLFKYRGKWVVLFFYPADFSFICPTELGELADRYEELKNMNVEIFSISTDTAFVHRAWHTFTPIINKVKFPMLADPTGKVSIDYGAYIEEEGVSTRATFIIDPFGMIKTFEIHDNKVGRNIDELMRKIKALQFLDKNQDYLCPVNWNEGKEIISVKRVFE